ncbi:hypothetical protein PoB_006113400 [Plakobranchus ocellatus]|uniref:Uncharacterized protein n=1 Tax=Plakobranchus ocellatus TaxID=259542 RepID=A0AAV4CRY2_9GAST|nr:hypothetical protein PoB_006113400 [Plakobranchus ocellatus]
MWNLEWSETFCQVPETLGALLRKIFSYQAEVHCDLQKHLTTKRKWFGLLYTVSPQQGDLRLSGCPSGQGVGGGARTRDRRFPANLRAASLAAVPPSESRKFMSGLAENVKGGDMENKGRKEPKLRRSLSNSNKQKRYLVSKRINKRRLKEMAFLQASFGKGDDSTVLVKLHRRAPATCFGL